MNLLKRMFLKVFKKTPPKFNSNIQKYIELGILNVGLNCNIDKLTIYIHVKNIENVRINIGKDSIVCGRIIIYSENSEVKIGERAFVGDDTAIHAYKSVEIGNDTMISWGCTLIDTNSHSLNSKDRLKDVEAWSKGFEYKDWSNVLCEKIKISENCWIGFNSIILKGVVLQRGCIVGAGSVVSKRFEEYSVITGNPAIAIKKTS